MKGKLAIPEDRIITECSSELMSDFISELSDFERMLKYLVQQNIFCPITTGILDVDESKLIKLKNPAKNLVQITAVSRKGLDELQKRLEGRTDYTLEVLC